MTEHYALHQTEMGFLLGLPDNTAPDLDAISQSITDLVLTGLLP